MADNTVLESLVQDLLKKNELLEAELDVFKDRAPLVGVRWYGEGGCAVGLRNPINGVKRLILQGYGDKGVIDQEAWNRMRSTDEVNWGILIRDDSVIEEMNVIGKVAKPDKIDSPNYKSREELISLLNGAYPKFEKFIESTTHHFVCFHCRKIAKELKINDARKLSLIESRYGFLLTKFRYNLMHKHDLKMACEFRKLPYEGLSDDQMIEALTKYELANDPSMFFIDEDGKTIA